MTVVNVDNVDGKSVRLGPHDPSGKTYSGGLSRKARERMQNERREKERAILDRIQEWNLYQYWGQPGKMVDEYRRLRRKDPAVNEEVNRLKRIPINKGQPITPDYVIDVELSSVYVFWIENLRKDPIRDKKLRAQMTDAEIKRERDKRIVKLDMDATTGCGYLEIHPESGIRILFGGDAHIPWGLEEQVDEDTGKPFVKIERYNHSSTKMNPQLRASGIRIDAEAFAIPRKGVEEDGEKE